MRCFLFYDQNILFCFFGRILAGGFLNSAGNVVGDILVLPLRITAIGLPFGIVE